ncbi:terminase small subunit [Gordonia phage Commandaria]|uniref:Terminase small subunit n=1 Tax=Gordonia phage Commandaria TaxID=3038364 RepID=A0AAF0K1X0_9CAUD|nr:terminase small subunit [Gordonia phage Commandaria]WGH20784.1 terminase small subunit [Gordonia phage Commandaria]
MAGTGPAPKPASARQRRNKASSSAVLKAVENPDIPPMPDAADWLGGIEDLVDGEQYEREWPKPVLAWWNDIWSSPMSNEFQDSDIHGLYLACFYLSQVLNPFLKMSDRISASKAYEVQVRNFGLNPMSRRTLQWEIERTEEAQERGKRRRSKAKSDPDRPEPADPRGVEEDNANPFTVVS